MIDLTDGQKEKILRRGVEANAFIHSPLFLDLKEWVDSESRLLGTVIALDKRDMTQEKLARSEFVEQMSGYYRGVQTTLSVFQGFIDKSNELQKLLNSENSQQQEEDIKKSKKAELEKKAYPNGR